MEGFEAGVGAPLLYDPLAADHTVLFPETSERFQADLSYIGTYLPEKRAFFKNVFPLKKKYTTCGLRTGLTPWIASWASFNGRQYFNIPILRSLQKPNWRWKMSGESIRPRPFRSMFMESTSGHTATAMNEHSKFACGDLRSWMTSPFVHF